MKRMLLLLFVTLTFLSCDEGDTPPSTTDVVIPDPVVNTGRIPCEGGMAGNYPCNGYDLMSHIKLTELGNFGNDSWGWTDPTTAKEYAIMCTDSGTSFVDISDAEDPIVLGKLFSTAGSSTWRDAKTYGNYLFIVSEADNHGMQVFDLTKLRDVDMNNIPVNFSVDAIYSGFGNAHNIAINENSPYAYALGSDTYGGGPHIVDISDPLNPVLAGGISSGGYCHDAQIVTYNGPDPDYQGREIFVGSNENEFVISDVTDPSSPVEISRVNYTSIGYTHQGWFTDNMRFFIAGDEDDESIYGFNTRTLVFDFIDLDNPSFRFAYEGTTSAIDHNGYVKGNELFLSNYSAGLRVINISSISSNSFNEVGYFDTYPQSNAVNFNGAWSVYPYFPSGNIIISDTNGGLFVVRKSQ